MSEERLQYPTNANETPERPVPGHPRQPEILPPGTPYPDIYPQKSPEVYPNPGKPEVSPSPPNNPEIYPEPSPQIQPIESPPEISG